MAAIDTLIAQIEDEKLRERLRREVDALLENKEFGLVFQDHLPELVPMYSEKVRKGSAVAIRGDELTNIWDVRKIVGKAAVCVNRKTKEERHIPKDDLVVVLQFGEPIFPSLVPVDKVQNGPEDAPWHTLIEADNYHALQLLEYLYAGQVDCIYIDPPYNTGARDWKYNNDYVDGNDAWRHSKWLSMIKRRLMIARRLLNPEKGVLIVTIDEHEMPNLRLLLQEVFTGFYIQMVTAVTNPKGVTQGRFSRVEEYVIYCFAPNAFVDGSDDNLLNPPEQYRKPRWKGLLRSGTNARRVDRQNMFYPVLIDENLEKVIGAGESIPLDQEPDITQKVNGFVAAWPIRTDGSFGNWGVGFLTLRELIEKGYVSLGRYDDNRKTYGISYLSEPNQRAIERGDILITNRDSNTNVVTVEYANRYNRTVKTVWHRTVHDAGAYGSDFVNDTLKGTGKFSFPKSIYSVRDSLLSIVRNRPHAVVVDFFAGSGTTLNSVNLLNSVDSGQRQCILVTNNEVSAEETSNLTNQGFKHGDEEWESLGICRSVTWPRNKFTILGKRDDGTTLSGDYLTGKTVEKEKARSFTHIGFVDSATLTKAKKKQMVAMIDGLPQTLVTEPCPFIVSEDHDASVLFETESADQWLEALDGQDHITRFFIVAEKKAGFDELKKQVSELLGPQIAIEEERRPMSEGFAANLEYFKLDFLDKDNVALGRQFREILPLLWLRAGAIGPRPELPKRMDIPSWMIPEKNPFAVLVDETKYAEFVIELEKRSDITHVFLITDSEDAFHEMAEDISAPNVIQLYRDYLENFMINKGDKE